VANSVQTVITRVSSNLVESGGGGWWGGGEVPRFVGLVGCPDNQRSEYHIVLSNYAPWHPADIPCSQGKSRTNGRVPSKVGSTALWVSRMKRT
jgi:hypothetical protein